MFKIKNKTGQTLLQSSVSHHHLQKLFSYADLKQTFVIMSLKKNGASLKVNICN